MKTMEGYDSKEARVLAFLETDITTWPLRRIAGAIQQHWSKVYFGAVPYLKAMHQMASHTEMYGYDSGESVVLYFLSNASTWRGEIARKIKAELRRRVSSA